MLFFLGRDADGNIVVRSGERYAVYACGPDLQPTTLIRDCESECPEVAEPWVSCISDHLFIPRAVTLDEIVASGIHYYPINQTLTPGMYMPIIENGRIVRLDRLD